MLTTVWSVSCLLFYSRCTPPCPVICESGGARAAVPCGVGATGRNPYNYAEDIGSGFESSKRENSICTHTVY